MHPTRFREPDRENQNLRDWTNVTDAVTQRGYFAIGVDRISKPMNVGNLMRSAHAFGASFFFTIGTPVRADEQNSDTSKSQGHVPFYAWDRPQDLALPKGCSLVGIELIEGAIDLPSFGHPLKAAYVLGPEKGVLSPELVTRCDYVIKIPTAFCINVAMAGAIVMYDRVRTLGRHAPRPVGEGPPRP
jgi:tRNA G18 (ribose-2'-O)-methylase SpoU